MGTKKDFTKQKQQELDTYFGGNSKLFEAIDIIDQAAIDGRLGDRAYQDFVWNRWLIYLASFEGFPTLVERFWWSVAFEVAGRSFNDLVMKPYLKVMVEKYWEQFKDGFKQSKNEGLVPRNIKTAEEYLALIFAPPETRLYTNDPILQLLGVKTGGELEALPYMEVQFKLAKMVVDGTFPRLHNTSFRRLQRAFDKNDAKDAIGRDCRIDKEKLERLQRDSVGELERRGIIRKGYKYQDAEGNIVCHAVDTSDPVDADQADARVRLIEQLKPRELDLFYAELERLEAEKTREEWYSPDKGKRVTQRMKYLKGKYSSH